LILILDKKGEKDPIDLDEFTRLVKGIAFLKRVFEYDLVIPEFEAGRLRLKQAYEDVKNDPNNEYSYGQIATYIPPLAKANPNWFATGFCSVDS